MLKICMRPMQLPLGSGEFLWGEVRAGQIDSPFLGQFSESSGRFS